MKPTRMFGLITLLLFSSLLRAELTIKEAEEITRDFKAKLIQTVNSKKASDVANLFDQDAIVILGNSKLIRTRTAIRAFMEAPFLDEDLKISHFIIDKIDVDLPIVIVDDNTFIATGKSKYKIIFNKTKQITLPNRWIIVFHRENGQWKMATYQGTVNAFDNPYIEDMRNIFYFISLVAFLLGIIVTVAWRRIKKSRIL